MKMSYHASIVLLTPETQAEIAWVQEHVAFEPWQVQGTAIAMDRRYAWDILEAWAEEHGPAPPSS